MNSQDEALAQRIIQLAEDAAADNNQEVGRILGHLYVCMQNPESLRMFDEAATKVLQEAMGPLEEIPGDESAHWLPVKLAAAVATIPDDKLGPAGGAFI